MPVAAPSTETVLNGLLYLRNGEQTARWNFKLAVGSSLDSPSGLGQGVSLTYSFLTQVPAYYATSGFSALTAGQQDVARSTLAAWAAVANISFQEVSGIGSVTFGQNAQTRSAGFAFTPGFSYSYDPSTRTILSTTELSSAGDVWLNATIDHGDNIWNVLLHELGHALGLKHPFEGSSTLGSPYDSAQWTVLSYNAHPHGLDVRYESTPSGYQYSVTQVQQTTPMLLDIIAIQYLYGANTTYRTGNDTYSFNPAMPFLQTIWDAGGSDTIDIANYVEGSYISLVQGTFSSLRISTASLPDFIKQAYPGYYDGTDNLAIAFGTVVENATGGSGPDQIVGNEANNRLEGRGGNDSLLAGAGNDVLDGGTGIDSLDGGDGSDIYYVDDLADVVIETNALAAGGADIVVSTVTYSMGANLENLLLSGLAAITGIGNGLANYLEGSAAANYLSGGAGTDTLKGLDGNDTYYVDDLTDVVIETNADLVTGGTDTVVSTVTYSLGANLENLLLSGLGAITGAGNAANNYIEGSAAANFLSGGAGADTLKGLDGNDTYYVDNAADVVIETNALPAGGTDTVVSTVTYTLGANLENLLLTSISAITGAGNAANNYIEGSAAANFLSGGAGTDTMKGLDGNDTYYVDDLTDVVIETNADLGTGGTDTVVSTVTYTLGANLENLLLTSLSAITGVGNAANNYIEGSAAANFLSGGAGVDTMKGNDGNDTYYVDDLTDVVIETNALPAGGTDTVVSSVTYTLGANLENLLLTGAGSLTGVGNAANNYIEGNAAVNFISGAAGADTMKGNDGNDTYYVDNAGDVVIETNADAASGGTDTVSSSVSYALGANLENLLLTGASAINGTGNTLANYLLGNGAANTLSASDGNDTLVGGEGTDSLSGGLGADTFDFNALSESAVGAARDVVGDFSSAQGDRIDLASIDANTNLANDQAFSFIGSAAFSSVAGQLRLSGNILGGDTNGDGTADFEIQLTGVASLVSGDFIL